MLRFLAIGAISQNSPDSLGKGGRNFMVDLLGYAASFAVLATFLMRTMVPLRLIAILSNLLFLYYGYSKHLYPVLVLHLVLLPINALRLIELRALPAFKPQVLLATIARKIGSKHDAIWVALAVLTDVAAPSVAHLIMAAHRI